jgi:hypothetical protein
MRLVQGLFHRECRLTFAEARCSNQTYLVDTFLAILRWLNDWPVGLKLNTPLSAFFCSSLSFLVQSWAGPCTLGVHIIYRTRLTRRHRRSPVGQRGPYRPAHGSQCSVVRSDHGHRVGPRRPSSWHVAPPLMLRCYQHALSVAAVFATGTMESLPR